MRNHYMMNVSRALLVLFLVSLLAFSLGCERKIVNENKDNSQAELNSCFTCHNDEDGVLQRAEGEWMHSVHASGNNIDYTNRGDGDDCTRCHDHQGFLEFLATDSLSAPYDNVSGIHCFTCHAPHTTGTLALRTEEAFTLLDGSTFDHGAGNLCANCHHSRVNGTLALDSIPSRYGPHHGPQADMLNGTNAFEFEGYTYSYSTHSVGIPDACVGCHMGNERNHSGYGVGGHSFNMEDEEGNNLYLYCADCHSAANTAKDYDFLLDRDVDHDGVIEGCQTEIDGLADSLKALLTADGLLNSSGSVISQKLDDPNKAGAVYNYFFIEDDRSHGVHNFKYATDLLQSAIEYMVAHP